jgi:hypothetical protein
MDSKKEVEVDDYVQYVDGSGVVCDEDGVPVRVIEIMYHSVLGSYCVFYNQGSFDYLSDVERVDPLMLELL